MVKYLIMLMLVSLPAFALGTSGSGSGLTTSGLAGSQAQQSLDFQPGLLTSVVNTKTTCSKVVKASTLDNFEANALLFTCAGNPTVTISECGTSTTCASPVTLASATLTVAGTTVDGTVNSTAIAAGDYVCWSISAGTCASINLSATAQIHTN